MHITGKLLFHRKTIHTKTRLRIFFYLRSSHRNNITISFLQLMSSEIDFRFHAKRFKGLEESKMEQNINKGEISANILFRSCEQKYIFFLSD